MILAIGRRFLIGWGGYYALGIRNRSVFQNMRILDDYALVDSRFYYPAELGLIRFRFGPYFFRRRFRAVESLCNNRFGIAPRESTGGSRNERRDSGRGNLIGLPSHVTK